MTGKQGISIQEGDLQTHQRVLHLLPGKAGGREGCQGGRLKQPAFLSQGLPGAGKLQRQEASINTV